MFLLVFAGAKRSKISISADLRVATLSQPKVPERAAVWCVFLIGTASLSLAFKQKQNLEAQAYPKKNYLLPKKREIIME